MPPFAKEQLRKIFVGGLNLSTTEESMKEYFSRWGECVDVVVMRYPDTRRSRGFGFVTFESVASVDAVLDAKPHTLDGKDVEPKRAVAKEEGGHPKVADTEKSKKIFVGGLASSTTEADVRECFEKFCEEAGCGKVVEVMLLKDKENDNRLRGFCFVIFDCDEIVDKVCSVKYFEIRTKTVEVRRAETRQAMRKKDDYKESSYKRRFDDSRRDMGDSRGSGGGGFSNRGMNQMAMQSAMGGGNGMPFFGGAFGGNRNGPGFGMNPYGGFGGMMGGFNPGMLNMLANSMGMSGMGNGMGGGMSGGMGGGGMGGGGMGNAGFRKDGGGSMRGQASTGGTAGKSGAYNADSGSPADTSGYNGQNSTGYEQSAAGGMSSGGSGMADMSSFGGQMGGQMGGMWGAGGNSAAANMQAAMLSGYTGTGMDNTGDYSQLGSYNQTSSYYGPSRGQVGKGTGTDTRTFKPY